MRRAGIVGTLPVTAVLVALAAVLVWTTAALGYQYPRRAGGYLAALAVCWLLFAAAVLLLRRVPARAVPAVVVAGTVLLGGAALSGPPDTSTDSARYAWDGIVQTAGVSPYAYVPADARLAALRPEWLFPAPEAGRCVQPRTAPVREVGGDRLLCTAINRPRVPTIYPPAAEVLFAAVRAVVPRTAAYWPLQAVGFLAAVGTVVLLLVALRRQGRDPRWAALWGWCPLVATEGVTNSHVDVVGAGLAVAATLLVVAGRPIRGGLLLGLAAAVKVLPLLVAPALLRRSPLRVGLAAIALVTGLYVPYVVASGPAVLGYLPGYLDEEGYDGGSRSALLSAVLPSSATTAVAAVLLLVVAGGVLVRSDPGDPWLGQLVLVAAALALASPRYGWYSLLLVPCIVMTGRWEVFAIPLALTAQQLQPDTARFRWTLLAAVLACLAGAVLRARRRRPILKIG